MQSVPFAHAEHGDGFDSFFKCGRRGHSPGATIDSIQLESIRGWVKTESSGPVLSARLIEFRNLESILVGEYPVISASSINRINSKIYPENQLRWELNRSKNRVLEAKMAPFGGKNGTSNESLDDL